jgi:hypothetical protein
MTEPLSPEEVAVLIRARQIQKDKGLEDDIDISGICKAAGTMRVVRKNLIAALSGSSPKGFRTTLWK